MRISSNEKKKITIFSLKILKKKKLNLKNLHRILTWVFACAQILG